MSWWRAAHDAFQHSLPDDRSFLALLAGWVGVVTIATLLLLGWESAGALVVAVGLAGNATIAAQSRRHRRPSDPLSGRQSPALPVLVRSSH